MHIIFHHLCYVHPVLVIGQWWSWTVSYTFSTVKASLYPVVLYPCLPSHFHNSCDVCFLFSCCLNGALHTAWVSIHTYNSSVWFITTWVSQNFSLKIWSCLKLVKDIPHVEKLINPVCVSKCFKISYKNNSRHAQTKNQKQILCSIASLTSCKGGEGKGGGGVAQLWEMCLCFHGSIFASNANPNPSCGSIQVCRNSGNREALNTGARTLNLFLHA